MTLSKTTSTALAVIPKDLKASCASATTETAPARSDSAETPATSPPADSFDPHVIPDDDDGPGAGGGYEPVQDPAESDGPGAGGGYDSHEIPDDDDGPGAGGGYEPVQDPAESDGPGAGGGYATISTRWNQPLALFSTSVGPHDIDVKSQYVPPWVQALAVETFSWTTNTAFEMLFADKVEPDPAKSEAPATTEGKKNEVQK